MSAEPAIYLDSSALVKLVVREAETLKLEAYLRDLDVLVSSELALVEVVRGVRAHGSAAVARAHALLERIELLALDTRVLRDAAGLDGAVLRSLDAIHLASARSLAPDLADVVTYDVRMAGAARVLGLPVTAPA